MVCPYCHNKTAIKNSRHLAKANGTWRRRQCLKCQALITTIESADYGRLWVIKAHDGRLRPFSRDKLFLSLYDSLKHRKTAVGDADALTATVISKLAKGTSKGQIELQMLTAMAVETLKRFDKVAAVHYRAYYS